MQQFIANLKNEGFKLKKRKKYWVFLILGCVISMASALRLLIANFITGGVVSREAILGGLMNSNLFFVIVLFLPLMAIMASCDLFVAEESDHTIRFSLMRPVRREKLFFSKALAVFLLCAIDLAVIFVVTTLTQLIPLAVLVLFFALVNQLAKSASLTVLLCVVLYLGLVALGTYLPSVGGLVFVGYLRWHNLWIGTTLPFLPMLSRIGLLAGYGLVFACGGYLLFERKEA